jgi:hypothetical protein
MTEPKYDVQKYLQLMEAITGTPHTEALHVVERYRLIDYETAKEAQERGGKENFRLPPGVEEGWAHDPNYKGKGLQRGAFREVQRASQRRARQSASHGPRPPGARQTGEGGPSVRLPIPIAAFRAQGRFSQLSAIN